MAAISLSINLTSFLKKGNGPIESCHHIEGGCGASCWRSPPHIPGMNRSNRPDADLTSFAAMLGNSFASKIGLLTQIIQASHYPSIGRYKERLLSKIISEYLPRNYEVGTGFVLFAHELTAEQAETPGLDSLNMASHSLSRQCDIIVFDSSAIPVIFRDEDFVIVRPESVRAIIEVKGSLNPIELANLLDSFFDFGKKWRECQLFYKTRHQPLTPSPFLSAMCWEIRKDTRGRKFINGTKIREKIAGFYNQNMVLDELKGFPRLQQLFVYNECQVCEMGSIENSEIRLGWFTESGQFIRYASGQPYRDGDRTIATLLACLHYYAMGDQFNRFYSYTDRTRDLATLSYEHQGFTSWLAEERHIRDANTDTVG
jgi:hypothetical protein